MDTHPTVIRFDRGTLLLGGARAAVEQLPGVLWDPRVAGYRAPAYRYHEIRARLDREIAVEDRLALTSAGPLEVATPPLRSYQRAALDAWESAGRRGVVVLPPGSGKTHVALGAIATQARPALVLVPTRVLLAQWADRWRRLTGQPAGIVGDGAHSVRPLTVCTFASALAHMDRLGEMFRVVVVDEVHHLGGALRGEAMEMCAAPLRLGLTATPARDLQALERLERLVGPVVSSHNIADLGTCHLAAFERVPVRVRLDDEEWRSYQSNYQAYVEACRLGCALGPPPGSRLPRAGRTARSRRAAAALGALQCARRVVSMARAKLSLAAELLEHHLGERVLVFAADNASAYHAARELLVPAITCDIRRRERAEILTRFGDGRYQAVVSAQVLNEGLDLPDCRIGIVLGRSRGGEGEAVQRLGRLLRPSPGKQAVLYELTAERTFEVENAER